MLVDKEYRFSYLPLHPAVWTGMRLQRAAFQTLVNDFASRTVAAQLVSFVQNKLDNI